MQNKRTIMCVSALLILIYHFWIPITSFGGIAHEVELYIRYVSFIGVDIFFFVSGFSLMARDTVYKSFIKNRGTNIYLKFVILALIAMVYKKWTVGKFLKVILGIDLFQRGGGAFLWFLPAIMILYIFAPLYKNIENEKPLLSLILLSLGWAAFTVIVSCFTDYKEIFIFTNRIPVFMLGYYFCKYNIIGKLKNTKGTYIAIALMLIVAGNIISYYVFFNYFSVSCVTDVFYLAAIPLILGVILLFELVKSNLIIDKISGITLELYGIQMIFGYKIAMVVSSIVNNALLCNLLILMTIVVFSTVYGYAYNKIRMMLMLKLVKRTEPNCT